MATDISLLTLGKFEGLTFSIGYFNNLFAFYSEITSPNESHSSNGDSPTGVLVSSNNVAAPVGTHGQYHQFPGLFVDGHDLHLQQQHHHHLQHQHQVQQQQQQQQQVEQMHQQQQLQNHQQLARFFNAQQQQHQRFAGHSGGSVGLEGSSSGSPFPVSTPSSNNVGQQSGIFNFEQNNPSAAAAAAMLATQHFAPALSNVFPMNDARECVNCGEYRQITSVNFNRDIIFSFFFSQFLKYIIHRRCHNTIVAKRWHWTLSLQRLWSLSQIKWK